MKHVFLFFFLLLLVNAIIFSDEYDDVKEILLTQDEESTRYREIITYLAKVNMGIPGGDNWIAEWNNHILFCYAINSGKIVKRYLLTDNWYKKIPFTFDIMKDIPGLQIDNSTYAIFDYNNDGVDEIFDYTFGASNPYILICGYDENIERVKYYCQIPFWIISPENGPAPVEFITYQGIAGFKIFCPTEGAVHPSKHAIEEVLSWYFFAWDEGSRQFVELAEIGEDIDYSMFTKTEADEPVMEYYDDPVEDRTEPIVLPLELEAGEENSIAKTDKGLTVTLIGAGIILALGLTVFIAARQKKKTQK
jgi:hypothetical protein